MARKKGAQGAAASPGAGAGTLQGAPANTYTSTNPKPEANLFGEERVAAVTLTRIPLNLIVENEFNPNEQTVSTFEGLERDIAEDGFDEPPQVVPMWGVATDKATWSMSSPEGVKDPVFYRIVGGQWRCRILRKNGYTHVDCVVKQGWDEIRFQIKTTRRNLQRGELNIEKFTKQVNELVSSYGQKVEDLPSLMGFETEHDFLAHYKREDETRRTTQTNLEKLAKETDDKLAAVDNLQIILTEIIRRYGDTLPNDFAHFFFNRKWHLMVRLDGESKKAIDRLVKHVKSLNAEAVEFEEKGFPLTASQGINEFLVLAIDNEIARQRIAREKAAAAVSPPDDGS